MTGRLKKLVGAHREEMQQLQARAEHLQSDTQALRGQLVTSFASVSSYASEVQKLQGQLRDSEEKMRKVQDKINSGDCGCVIC